MEKIQVDSSDLKNDAQGIWTQAELFRDAGNALLDRVQYFPTHELQLKITIPVSTNMAFASELYLKCLYFLDHNKKYPSKKSGHNLLNIFDSLFPATQNEITGFYDYYVEVNKLSETVEHGFNFNIRVILTKVQSAFVDFRYIYEPKIKINAGIDAIMNAARVTIANRKPTWKLWDYELVIDYTHTKFAEPQNDSKDTAT